jgi:predicted secreted protein
MQRKPIAIPALILALFASVATGQQQPLTYDRIDLNASAEREVDNDLLIAMVYAEVEDSDQADAANTVNEAIAWASEQAEAATGIEWQTAQYTTRPVYANDRRIVGWVVRQSLRLESEDAEALSELLGVLQSSVAVESIGTALSKPRRDEAEEALIAEAIAAFRRRADLVTRELGRSDYRLVYMNVGTTRTFAREAQLARFGADAAISAPTVEAGVQTVSVIVNGTIELEDGR